MLDPVAATSWAAYSDFWLLPHVQHFESASDLIARAFFSDLQPVVAAMRRTNQVQFLAAMDFWEGSVHKLAM